VSQELAVFEKERARVADGEVKYHGEWLTTEQAEKRRDEIQGEAYYDAMKEYAARGDLIGALNTFDLIEKQTPGTRIHPDAVELAGRVIAALDTDIERRLLIVKNDFEKLTQDYKTMTDEQKVEVSNSLKREYARLDAVMLAAEKAKVKWVPLQPRSKKSLEKLKATITAEKTRIAALSVSKMKESLQLANSAVTELAANDVAAAEADNKEALAAWPQNALALRTGKEITARKADTSKPTTTKPAATPTPVPKATPKPVASPTPKPKKSWFSFGS
jgi:hypothetical protein